MNNQKQGSGLGIAVVIIAVVFILGMAVYGLMHLSSGRGGTSNADAIALDTSLTAGTFITVGTTLTVGATTSIATAGTPGYYTVGGLAHADVSVTLSSTSSVPAIVKNPFGATTSVVSIDCNITANGMGSQNLDISTTSAASGYGSSTPAFVYGFTVGTAGGFIHWDGGTQGTSSPNVLGNAESLKGGSGAFPFILGPTESITARIATGTPGTFASYLTGKCGFGFIKP